LQDFRGVSSEEPLERQNSLLSAIGSEGHKSSVTDTHHRSECSSTDGILSLDEWINAFYGKPVSEAEETSDDDRDPFASTAASNMRVGRPFIISNQVAMLEAFTSFIQSLLLKVFIPDAANCVTKEQEANIRICMDLMCSMLYTLSFSVAAVPGRSEARSRQASVISRSTKPVEEEIPSLSSVDWVTVIADFITKVCKICFMVLGVGTHC
jgi:hypothetical protein